MSVEEPKIAPTTPARDADRADERRRARRDAARAGGTAGRWSCAPCAAAPAPASPRGRARSGSWWSPSSGTATSRCAAVGRHQQRLGAGAEDAVAPLQLRPVDGEIGLMDERVRVLRVLREAGDADRDGGADRLARRLDVEQLLGDRAADPLRDLHRLLGRRLRQQDRELLAAEAGRHVVVAQLGAEDLGDPLQHRVAGEMAVACC